MRWTRTWSPPWMPWSMGKRGAARPRRWSTFRAGRRGSCERRRNLAVRRFAKWPGVRPTNVVQPVRSPEPDAEESSMALRYFFDVVCPYSYIMGFEVEEAEDEGIAEIEWLPLELRRAAAPLPGARGEYIRGHWRGGG